MLIINFVDRLRHSWNAFVNRDPTKDYRSYENGTYYRPDRPRLTRGNERTIVTSVFNRIALDVASISIRHCRLDDDDRYREPSFKMQFFQCLMKDV